MMRPIKVLAALMTGMSCCLITAPGGNSRSPDYHIACLVAVCSLERRDGSFALNAVYVTEQTTERHSVKVFGVVDTHYRAQ